MTEPLIEARGLSAGYGTMAVVRGVDLHVGPGEVVALIGANGAGKTTTLLTLAGELAPLDGDQALAVDGARLGRDGIDRVEFLISPNKGIEPKPLRKIASASRAAAYDARDPSTITNVLTNVISNF